MSTLDHEFVQPDASRSRKTDACIRTPGYEPTRTGRGHEAYDGPVTGGIFLLSGDTLVEMREQAYDSEDLLQGWLARYPDLLAGGDQLTGSLRRWLLVKREAGIPDREAGGSRWSLDHLFIDQEAVPTLVEVKRSDDTRIRHPTPRWPAARLPAPIG